MNKIKKLAQDILSEHIAYTSYKEVYRLAEAVLVMHEALEYGAKFTGNHYAPLRSVGEECKDSLAKAEKIASNG